jgi:hypothetical protein
MENTVVVIIALEQQAKAEEFETYFRESVQKIREKDRIPDVTLSLYRPVEGEQEFVWMTRYPEEELNRVSRADWPFVVLAMLDMLREIRRRFAANVSVVASSSVLTADGLVEQWNQRHGRFTKMSLEAQGTGH